MNKALVTGGAGFVGHHLSTRLLDLGCDVVVLDDLSTGYRENVPAQAEFVLGDIRNEEDVARAMAGCDTVFHLAARVELRKAIVDPADCYSVNVAGTARIVAQCLKQPGRRLVFASSCAIYPLHPEHPLKEEHAGTGETPYALSKFAGEQTLEIYSRLKGLSCCSLRCFNIYGPRQRADSPYSAVIPRFIDKALKGEPLTVYGDGRQTRDFISVADVVDGYLLAAESSATGAYNLATGEGSSIDMLADSIGDIAAESGFSPSKVYRQAVDGDASASVADLSLANDVLKFFPKKRLKDGLTALFRHWKDEAETAAQAGVTRCNKHG